jgi:hypothetical protein
LVALKIGVGKLENVKPVDCGDSEVDVDFIVNSLIGTFPVQMEVEVLIRVDAAQFVQSRGPNVPPHDQKLIRTIALTRSEHFRVHKIHSELRDQE